MATKQELDKLLDGDAPPKKPAIRRGQGLRLSTESPPEVPAEAAAIDEAPLAAEAAAPPGITNEPAQQRITATTHNRTSAKVRSSADLPVRHKRINRGYKLREDLVKACKRIALEEDRKLYEVMEEALAKYVAQKIQEQGT